MKIFSTKTGDILSLFVLIILIFNVNFAFAGKGDSIIDKVEKKIMSLGEFSVHFEMRFEADGTDDIQQLEGTLYWDGEHCFRMQTPQQVIVSDGETLWMYDTIENQVLIYDPNDGIPILTPRQLLYEYSEGYRIEKIEKTEYAEMTCDLLYMLPKEPTDPTRSVKVWVDRKERLTRKLLTEDLVGNITIFEFENFDCESEIPEDIYHFDPPAGVEIIDMR